MSFADGLLRGAQMGAKWVAAYKEGQEWQDEENFRKAIADADKNYVTLQDEANNRFQGNDKEIVTQRLNALADARAEYDNQVRRAYLDNYGGRGSLMWGYLNAAENKNWANRYAHADSITLRENQDELMKGNEGKYINPVAPPGAISTVAQPKQPVQHAPAPTAAAPAPAAPAAPTPSAAAPAPNQANNRYTAPIAQAILNGDPATLEMVNAIAEQNGFKVLSNKKQIMWQPLSGGDPVMADPRMITSLLNRYLNVSKFLQHGGEA